MHIEENKNEKCVYYLCTHASMETFRSTLNRMRDEESNYISSFENFSIRSKLVPCFRLTFELTDEEFSILTLSFGPDIHVFRLENTVKYKES